MGQGSAVVLHREQGEAVGVIEAALPAGEPEEEHRADDQEEADEDLQNQDVHEGSFLHPRLRADPSGSRVSCAVVASTVVSELMGMRMAHQSGVITPASASETVMTL